MDLDKDSSPVDYVKLKDKPPSELEEPPSSTQQQEVMLIPSPLPKQKKQGSKGQYSPYYMSESERIQHEKEAEETKNRVIARMKVIEDHLDHGWYQCFIVWLYFFVLLAVANFIQSIIFAVEEGSLGSLILSFICAVWMVNQCMLEISSMKTRHSPKAKRAFSFMVIYIVMDLGAIIFYALWYKNPQTTTPNKNSSQSRVQAYAFWMIIIYSVVLALHLVSVFGSRKVRRLLKKRDTLRISLGLSLGLINWTWN